MRFWHHILITFCLLFPFVYGTEVFYGAMAFALFGAIFPDVDAAEPKRTGGALAKVLHALKLILYYPISMIFSILTLKNAVKHRGFAHSIMAAVIFSAMFYAAFQFAGLSKDITFFFLIGYLLHLLEDCFTPSGTTPLLPFGPRISGRIETSSPLLSVVSLCFAIPIALFLVSYMGIEAARNAEILMLAAMMMTLKIDWAPV